LLDGVVGVPIIDNWWLLLQKRRTSYIQWFSDLVEKSCCKICNTERLLCSWYSQWWLIMKEIRTSYIQDWKNHDVMHWFCREMRI